MTSVTNPRVYSGDDAVEDKQSSSSPRSRTDSSVTLDETTDIECDSIGIC